jgi:hypothetical protein
MNEEERQSDSIQGDGRSEHFSEKTGTYTAATSTRLRRMTSSGMLLRVLLRTDVSQERSASIVRLTRIDEVGTC